MSTNRNAGSSRDAIVLRLIFLATIIAVGILAGCSNRPTLETCDDVYAATSRGGTESSASSRGDLVERVIDGDTIVLANGERVRYIGVDTPERGEPFFVEATELNRRLTEGRRVTLLTDKSDRDRFGRLLRYVVAGDILVNAELVREGMAEATRYEPHVKFAACFEALMEEAKEERRGIWRR